ncbi:MAG TPA: hypothetical protein VKG24_10325, partial [Pseudolabrys sp.]|nr:hypothetical protein [Pseudolabrys sp.]
TANNRVVISAAEEIEYLIVRMVSPKRAITDALTRCISKLAEPNPTTWAKTRQAIIFWMVNLRHF